MRIRQAHGVSRPYRICLLHLAVEHLSCSRLFAVRILSVVFLVIINVTHRLNIYRSLELTISIRSMLPPGLSIGHRVRISLRRGFQQPFLQCLLILFLHPQHHSFFLVIRLEPIFDPEVLLGMILPLVLGIGRRREH